MKPRPEPLKVCDKCGWYAHSQWSPNECNPAGGKHVDRLAALVAVPVTKLGYGRDVFVFETDDRFHIRLQVTQEVRDARPFQLRDVWLIGSLSPEAARDLVETLAAWRKRHPKKETK